VAGEAARLREFLDPLLAAREVRILLTGAGTSAHIGECLAPSPDQGIATQCRGRPDDRPRGQSAKLPVPRLRSCSSHSGRSGNSPERRCGCRGCRCLARQCSHFDFHLRRRRRLYKRCASRPSSHAYCAYKSNDRSFAILQLHGNWCCQELWRFAPCRRRHPVSCACTPGGADSSRQRAVIRSLVSENFERVVYLGSKEFKGARARVLAENARDEDGKVVAIEIPPSASATAPRPYSIATTLVCGIRFQR